MGLFNFLKKDKKETESEVVQEEQNKPKEKATKILTKDDVMNMEDESQLLDIIKGKYDWDMISCAVSKLKNQRQLIDYIKSLKSNSDSQKRGAIIDGPFDDNMINNPAHQGLFGITYYLYRNRIKYNIHGHLHEEFERVLDNGTIEKSLFGINYIELS